MPRTKPKSGIKVDVKDPVAIDPMMKVTAEQYVTVTAKIEEMKAQQKKYEAELKKYMEGNDISIIQCPNGTNKVVLKVTSSSSFKKKEDFVDYLIAHKLNTCLSTQYVLDEDNIELELGGSIPKEDYASFRKTSNRKTLAIE